MTTSFEHPGAVFQSCVDEAIMQAPLLIDRWSTRLVDVLYERSMAAREPAERRQIQETVVALKKNRFLIQQAFPLELKKLLTEDAGDKSARKIASSAGSRSSVSFDELELMDDDQVQETVENAQVQQFIRLGCEAGLAGFTARLSTAQGFLVVKADSNPLRPEIMTQALLRTLKGLPVTRQSRTAWLVDGARLMGEELQLLYEQLNEFLTAHGISPAAYAVISTPEARSARDLPQQKTPGVAAVENSPGRAALEADKPEVSLVVAERKQLLTLDHLHRLLMGDYDNAARTAPCTSDDESAAISHRKFSHTLPLALDVLPELQEKARSVQSAHVPRTAPAPSLAALRDHLKTEAKSLGQSLAIEVVCMMIEQIANDERLLMPVRQIIANAEPAFLRLAVTDPRFFSDRSHPARRLLETITSSSLGYASEDANGFQEFMQSLNEVAILLTEEHASDAQHFAELLRNFERKQNRNTPENRQAQRRAVQALVQAEERNLMAANIAGEIRSRADFVDRNPVIAGFVTGPWSQVMAKDRLQRQFVGAPPLEAQYSRVLDDLFWSLDATQVVHQRKRLLEVTPKILKLLRDGLESIEYPPEQSRPFFDALMAIHQAGLKGSTGRPTASSESIDSLHKMFDSAQDRQAAQPWLAPMEVAHSGFMQDWDDSVPGSSESPATLPGNDVPANASSSVSAASVSLNLGDWVELFVETAWLRAQLTWVSPRETLFMFTSEGGRKHSMSLRVLNQLLDMELVKVISQQGLLDGALDSVARTAMRNSVERKGGFESISTG